MGRPIGYSGAASYSRAADQSPDRVDQSNPRVSNRHGIAFPLRSSQVRHKLPFVLEDAENGLTATARAWLSALAEELQALDQRIATTDTQIAEVFKGDDACQRLAQLAGIGPLTATALVAAVGDATGFRMGGSSPLRSASSLASIPRAARRCSSG